MHTDRLKQSKFFKQNKAHANDKLALGETPSEYSTPTSSVSQDSVHAAESLPKSIEVENDSIHQQVPQSETIQSVTNATESAESKPHQVDKPQPEDEEGLNKDVVSTDAKLGVSNSTTNSENIEVDDYLLEDIEFISPSKRNERNTDAKLAVVNHENGKRVKLNKSICTDLALAPGDTVDIAVKNKQVFIKKSIDNKGHIIKPNNLIYGASLVDVITKEFAFDYSNVSTHHLNKVVYKTSNNQLVAIITK